MNLTRKIQKLFTKEAYRSASRHSRKLLSMAAGDGVKAPFPLTPENLLRAFDGPEFKRIQKQYGVTAPTECNPKYISFPTRWLQTNIDRIKTIELDFGPKRNVLDIGCGAGYFLFISQLLGHTVVGMDIDQEPIFREMTQLLKVDRKVCRIEAFVPLPDLGRKLDVVTAHLLCFNGHHTDAVWGVKEWSYFLTDLSRQLNPDAELYFEMNSEPGNIFLTDGLLAFFRDELHAYVTPSRRNIHLKHRQFGPALAKH